MSSRIVGVIDISRTTVRVAVVDLDAHAEIDARKMANTVVAGEPYPHYDAEAIWAFVTEALADLNRAHPFDALSVAAHDATAALLDAEGELALPILDHDYAGPDTAKAEYDRLRPDFTETLSQRLPAGRNLGAQLHWQARVFPADFARVRSIVPYPQYWGFRLTGVAASEETSLGCHTDLWNFETDLYSSLVLKQGWLDRMPEVRAAADILGLVKPDLCATLGLRPRMPVHVGIEEASAALLPHLIEHKPPFALVSSGNWLVSCAPGGNLATLDPKRDCFAGLDALGRPLPTARFMGGMEFARLVGDAPPAHVSDGAVARVLDESIMLLPSVAEGSGPFPGRKARWTYPEHTLDAEARFVAVSFYLAMMTAECLELTGADGNTIVDGPVASNRLFVEMLVAATGRPVEPLTGARSNVALGAAMLARMQPRMVDHPARAPIQGSQPMALYAEKWRAAVSG